MSNLIGKAKIYDFHTAKIKKSEPDAYVSILTFIMLEKRAPAGEDVTFKQLCKKLNISKDIIIRELNNLVEDNLIIKAKVRGLPNIYILNQEKMPLSSPDDLEAS
jgi:predicted transcriptional regulator